MRMKTKFLLPILALSAALLGTSCSKKEYAFFSPGRPGAPAVAKASAPVAQAPAEAQALATPAPAVEATTIASFETAAPAAKPAMTQAQAQEALASVKQMNVIQKVKLAREVRQALKEASTQQVQETTATKAGTGKSQLIALLLFIFLWPLAVHRFYLGYIGIGILQILTFGFCGIWYLIDFIRILTGDLEPKGQPYKDTF